MIGPHFRPSSFISTECLDDYLLKLILIDTVAVTDSRRSRIAEHVIEQFVPSPLYEQVMSRYDALTDDSDDEHDLLALCFVRAAERNSEWKATTLAQLLRVVAVNGTIEPDGMDEVGRLAEAIGANREFRAVANLPLY